MCIRDSTYSQSAQTWITQFYLQIIPCLQITQCLPFLRKRSPDGATPNWCSRHPIAVYYSLIDPEGMKGWDGLVGWPIADGLRLPTYRKWSSVSYTSSARQESSPAKDRCYTTVPLSQPRYASRVSVKATIVSWGAVRNVNQSINQSTILGLRSHSQTTSYTSHRAAESALSLLPSSVHRHGTLYQLICGLF